MRTSNTPRNTSQCWIQSPSSPSISPSLPVPNRRFQYEPTYTVCNVSTLVFACCYIAQEPTLDETMRFIAGKLPQSIITDDLVDKHGGQRIYTTMEYSAISYEGCSLSLTQMEIDIETRFERGSLKTYRRTLTFSMKNLALASTKIFGPGGG